jgi:hypothetical protein
MQHASHTDLVHLYGYDFQGQKVDMAKLAKAGHPGDSFTIFSSREGQIRAFATPRSRTQADLLEANEVLKQRQIDLGEDPVGLPESWLKWPD